MSLIKTKSNNEVWGTVDWHGRERARFITRIGHIMMKRIDDFHVLMLGPEKCDIMQLINRNSVSEQEYVAKKRNAYKVLHSFGRCGMKNYIVKRVITFEGGMNMIPREHRQYRMSNKPIGK